MSDNDHSVHFIHLQEKFAQFAQLLKPHKLVDIVFSKHHLLGLTAFGTVVSAGSNQFGQLGRGVVADLHDKIHDVGVVPKLSEIVCIGAGETHSVALSKLGDVYTWGSSLYGQCATLTKISFSPYHVPRLPPIKHVVCGAFFTAALSEDGHVYEWGDGCCGQLGIGGYKTADNRPRNVPIFDQIVKMSAGFGHVAVLTRHGEVLVWGLNASGQIGNNADSSITFPSKLAVSNVNEFTDIVCAPNATFLLDRQGRVYKFGRNFAPNQGELIEIDHDRHVTSIAQCGSALLCRVATSILRTSVSAVSASGGTLITIYANAIANIRSAAWIRFHYHPYVNIVIQVDFRECQDLQLQSIDVVSPPLHKMVPGELFPIRQLGISISIDGSYYCPFHYISVYRPIYSLNPSESQCGPVSGGTQVRLSVDIDDIPYPDLTVQLVPIGDHRQHIQSVPAKYYPQESVIEFISVEIDEPVDCFFSIALDGNLFTEYPEPYFVYYDLQVMGFEPSRLPFCGGEFNVTLSGLTSSKLGDITSRESCVKFQISPGGFEYKVIGTCKFEPSDGTCQLFVKAPAIESATNAIAHVLVSYNGIDFMECGQVEYMAPKMNKISPTCGPRGRDLNVSIFGDYFYPNMSNIVSLTSNEIQNIKGLYNNESVSFQIPSAVSAASPTTVISYRDDQISFTFYEEPFGIKVEPMGGAASGGYPVKISGKGFFKSECICVRIKTDASTYVVPGTIISESNAKTGLAVISFDMPAVQNEEKHSIIEISLNGTDFTQCSEQPFVYK